VRGRLPIARHRAPTMKERVRVGIVDDSPDMRSAIRMVLELDGHSVWEACDGRQALESKLDRDDILLLDARMKGIDGFSVLETLAERPGGMPRVIMLSADASAASRERAMAAGAVAYLTKPFDVTDLLELIENVAAGREPIDHETTAERS
jgi:CheY-like chemotaxis protein